MMMQSADYTILSGLQKRAPESERASGDGRREPKREQVESE